MCGSHRAQTPVGRPRLDAVRIYRCRRTHGLSVQKIALIYLAPSIGDGGFDEQN